MKVPFPEMGKVVAPEEGSKGSILDLSMWCLSDIQVQMPSGQQTTPTSLESGEDLMVVQPCEFSENYCNAYFEEMNFSACELYLNFNNHVLFEVLNYKKGLPQ
jgi:hypothetical protein